LLSGDWSDETCLDRLNYLTGSRQAESAAWCKE